MSTKHTSTPWEHIHMFDGEEIIRGNLNQEEPTIIAVLKSQVYAAKIVECVNDVSEVFNETGKTPRQLADENKRLLEALVRIKILYLHSPLDEYLEPYKEAWQDVVHLTNK